MWGKLLVAGAAVLTMGMLAHTGNDLPVGNAVWESAACASAGANQGTPGGIPYSNGIGYMSGQRAQEVHSDKDGSLLMVAKTFEVNLSQEDAVKYPKLQAALEKLSQQNMTDMQHMIVNWKPDLMATYEINRENRMFEGSDAPFAYELKYAGLRADTTVFSCFATEYVYLGGTHPTTAYDAYVFDTQSGKQLELKDILTNTDNLAEIIADEANSVEEYQPRLPERAELVKLIQELIDTNNLKYGLTEDGMEIFFSNYDIGPYAIGTFIVDIPQSKYFTLFNPKYIFYGQRPKG